MTVSIAPANGSSGEAFGRPVFLRSSRSKERARSTILERRPKVAQERLGPSSAGITLDLYSHVLPVMREGAAAQVDAEIRAAIDLILRCFGSKWAAKACSLRARPQQKSTHSMAWKDGRVV